MARARRHSKASTTAGSVFVISYPSFPKLPSLPPPPHDELEREGYGEEQRSRIGQRPPDLPPRVHSSRKVDEAFALPRVLSPRLRGQKGKQEGREESKDEREARETPRGYLGFHDGTL